MPECECGVYDYECETKVICNEETVYPRMRQFVEEEGLSVNAAAEKVNEESGKKVTVGKARLAYIRRCTHVQPDNAIAAKVRQMVVSEPHRLFVLDDLWVKWINGELQGR